MNLLIVHFCAKFLICSQLRLYIVSHLRSKLLDLKCTLSMSTDIKTLTFLHENFFERCACSEVHLLLTILSQLYSRVQKIISFSYSLTFWFQRFNSYVYVLLYCIYLSMCLKCSRGMQKLLLGYSFYLWHILWYEYH